VLGTASEGTGSGEAGSEERGSEGDGSERDGSEVKGKGTAYAYKHAEHYRAKVVVDAVVALRRCT
jgi:hypothetical protein